MQNKAVEDFLFKYVELPYAPEYAVMLTGSWGCGKTYFINKFIERLNRNNIKPLYISLYGLSTFTEVEDEFFSVRRAHHDAPYVC